MIVIALGANLPSDIGPPRETLQAALKAMDAWPSTKVMERSSWYRTDPVGPIDQPPFVNGVVIIETALSPVELLRHMLNLEQSFGRERVERWGPRTLDLDIIDYQGWVAEINADGLHLTLPHPRLEERSFVLIPLSEVAPTWVHPASQKGVRELLVGRPEGEKTGILPLKAPES